jgi:hypothetical protein
VVSHGCGFVVVVSKVRIAPVKAGESVWVSKAGRQGLHESCSKDKDLDVHCILSLASLITRTRLFFVPCQSYFQADKGSNQLLGCVIVDEILSTPMAIGNRRYTSPKTNVGDVDRLYSPSTVVVSECCS